MGLQNVPKHVILDVFKNRYIALEIKQYDKNSREIIVNITYDGKPYIVDNTVVPRIKCKKSDGKYIINDCTVLDDGSVKIDITEQMTTAEGQCNCELALFDSTNDKILHTMNFIINVKEAVFADDEVTSSDEFIALSNALLKADELKNLVDEVTNEEAIRVQNEIERQSNEQIRQSNEEIRESNENTRQENTNIAITNTENAISEAISATSDAISATENANAIIEKMEALIADDNLIHVESMGVANGVATLDENGYIPSYQLPSYVDDVLDGIYDEENEQFLDIDGNAYTPESGKIYVDVNTRITYRWSGTLYVEIASSLALGITDDTAFQGSRGYALEQLIGEGFTAITEEEIDELFA